MIKKTGVIITFFLFLLLFHLSYKSSFVYSQSDHIVISEIQVIGSSANDEFVELYNPTDINFDLTGWKLRKVSSTGTESALVASLSGTIKSHGYFLIVHPDYSQNYQFDNLYSSNSYAISNNNAVILEDSSSLEIDKVGWGLVPTPAFENQAALGPGTGESLERKANDSSTLESMISGLDFDQGNSHDSNNNANDFVLRNIPDPQGNNSSIEPPEEPTSTETPTNTPTSTPEPTMEPTSTPQPTQTPTPTEEPTITPTESPEITITPTTTPQPSISISPSETPQITPTPTGASEITPSLTPTPIVKSYQISFLKLTCGFSYSPRRFGFLSFRVPTFFCS